MKTSLYLPQGIKRPQDLLHKELAQARNIKDKSTKKRVILGLKKMLHVLGDVEVLLQGIALFTDGQELAVQTYEGRERIYRCGREYHRIVPAEFHPTLLVAVDANEATIGATNGENISVLWNETSLVPRKHNNGGQSQNRFQRGRQEALKQWLRKVVDMTKDQYQDGQELIVGGPGMTKDKFVAELPI